MDLSPLAQGHITYILILYLVIVYLFIYFFLCGMGAAKSGSRLVLSLLVSPHALACGPVDGVS